MLSTIRKVCVLPKDKFYINLANTGNTVSSTVLIGLKDCLNNETIKPGMQVIITGFGVGLSWGTVAFTTDNLVVPTLVEVADDEIDAKHVV